MARYRCIYLLFIIVVIGHVFSGCGAGTNTSSTSSSINSASPLAAVTGISWAKTYWRLQTYRASNMIEQTTIDNGYITGGTFTLDNNIPTASLVKLDTTGSIIWQKMYYSGWISGYSSMTNVVRATNDGGYIMGGGIGDIGGFPNLLVLKTNSDGSVAWQKQYHNISDRIYDLRSTADGGYIIVARKSDLIAVLKLYGDGTVAWEKDYSDTSGVYSYAAYTIQQTMDSGFVVSGYVNKQNINPIDNSDQATWVMKLDPFGNILWTNAYVEISSYAVLQSTDDGGFILGGAIGSGNADAMVMKLTASGAISWVKRYQGSGSSAINWIRQLSDGTYIAAGKYNPTGINEDFWVLKLNRSGGITWQKSYGGTASDQGYVIQECLDGGYIVAGSTTSFGDPNYANSWILKLKSDGSCSPLDIDTAVRAFSLHGFNSEVTSITASPLTPVVSDTDLAVADINVTVTQQAP